MDNEKQDKKPTRKAKARATKGAKAKAKEAQGEASDKKREDLFRELEVACPTAPSAELHGRYSLPKVDGIGFRLAREDKVDAHKHEKNLIPVTQTSPDDVKKAVGLKEGEDVAKRGKMVVLYGRQTDSEKYYERCRKKHEQRMAWINQGRNPMTGDAVGDQGEAKVVSHGGRKVFDFAKQGKGG